MTLPADLLPSLPILGLGGAAFAFYVAARIGADALTSKDAHDPRAGVGGVVLAHWLPMAAVAVLMVRAQPEGAVSAIFASSVACISLALGTTLVAAPAPLDPRELSAAPHRRAWAMLLPAAVIALLAGFSGRLTLKHALVLFIQGIVTLLLWSDRRPDVSDDSIPTATRVNEPARRVTNPAMIAVQLFAWVTLALGGAWLANRSTAALETDVPRLTVGIIAALMVAPALILSLIGTGLSLSRDGRGGGAVISTCVGCALLNLCVLLPLTILVWHVVAAFRKAGIQGLRGTAWLDPLPTETPLAYPMAVWRIDTVLLVVFGAMLLLISTGRWFPRRFEAAVLLLVYAFYMGATAALAGR